MGHHCHINVDECESDPCLHGHCVDLINAYRCECNEGWEGHHCQNNIMCVENPCQNGGEFQKFIKHKQGRKFTFRINAMTIIFTFFYRYL